MVKQKIIHLKSHIYKLSHFKCIRYVALVTGRVFKIDLNYIYIKSILTCFCGKVHSFLTGCSLDLLTRLDPEMSLCRLMKIRRDYTYITRFHIAFVDSNYELSMTNSTFSIFFIT